MGLRLFADQCVPYSIIEILQNEGHEVLLLKDYIRKDSLDSLVISKALELEAILISLNGDFTDIVTYPPRNYGGIITLQVRNHPEVIPQIIGKLKKYLSTHNNMIHYKGKLFLVEVDRIRVRE